MRIPLHNLLSNVSGEMRSIYKTEPNEVRYFKINGEDEDREIRVSGTPSGGLKVEELKGDKWNINTTALPRLGDGVIEVSRSE